MRATQKIVIFGAGGHGRVILDILLSARRQVLGFIDDNPEKKGQLVHGYEILGDWAAVKGKKGVAVALGIGDNRVRRKVFDKAKAMKLAIASAIHPAAIVSKQVKLGEGVAIMPGAVVNAGSVLEDGVVVNTGATVDHDCHLAAFSQIWPGAHLAGTVSVGELSYIGAGAVVIQNLKIGRNTVVGAGAAVVRDLPDNVVAVGVPAKPARKNNGE